VFGMASRNLTAWLDHLPLSFQHFRVVAVFRSICRIVRGNETFDLIAVAGGSARACLAGASLLRSGAKNGGNSRGP